MLMVRYLPGYMVLSPHNGTVLNGSVSSEQSLHFRGAHLRVVS